MEVISDTEVETYVERGQYSTTYTKDDLREAVHKIRNNEMSYGAASDVYNVPKSTLFNKMKNPHEKRRGATTTLSKVQEVELSDWILLHQRFGDPRTKQDIVLAAGEIAKLDENCSRHFKNGLPTSGWVDGFLKRYPKIVYRIPEAISKASANNTKEDFSGLWRNIYDYMQQTNQLHLLNMPEIWWNADETNFAKDVLPKKVLARKGSKNVHRRERGKPKDNTTVTYAFSAAGDFIEPLITLKDSISSLVEISFALGSVGANYGLNQTDSGWAQTDSFYYYVTMYLHKQWELKNISKPRILTIDGYGAHLSLRLFRWSRLNDVIIIVLYPGGTPYLQMCDTTMFAPMKTKHAVFYQQWRQKYPTKTMDEVEFVKILKQVNDAVIRSESIVNGWRATGLQPFNFNNLNCDDLIAKSPDQLYDFKGYHIGSSENLSTINTSIGKSPINVVSNVVLDPTSKFFIEPGNLSNLITSCESIVYLKEDETIENYEDDINMTNQPQFNDHQITENYDTVLRRRFSTSLEQNPLFLDLKHTDQSQLDVEQNSLFLDSIHSMQSTDHDQLSHIERNSFLGLTHLNRSLDQPGHLGHNSYDGNQLDVEQRSLFSDSNHSMNSNDHNQPSHTERNSFLGLTHLNRSLDQPGQLEQNSRIASYDGDEALGDENHGAPIMNNCINFSAVSGCDGFLRSKFDTNFDLATFGLTSESVSMENGSKIAKLTEKIRRDVKELCLF